MELNATQEIPRCPDAPAPKRRKNGVRLSRFCFTLNNWSPDEWNWLTKSFQPTWMVIGKEIGENGTRHLQGAVVLGQQMAFSHLKTLNGFRRAHVEQMRGSPQDSLTYCTKQDSDPYVYGSLPLPGKRNDLLEAVRKIKTTLNFKQLIRDDDEFAAVFLRYDRGINSLRAALVHPRVDAPIVVWLYGKTGTGKTRACIDFAHRVSDNDYWISSGGFKWFDGYTGQPVAIFDDFRAKQLQGEGGFAYLLRVLDRYPLQVPIKGGFVQWIPKFIFITTPNSPGITFEKRAEHIPEDIEQLNRRISKVFEIPGDADEMELFLSQYTGEGHTSIPDSDMDVYASNE